MLNIRRSTVDRIIETLTEIPASTQLHILNLIKPIAIEKPEPKHINKIVKSFNNSAKFQKGLHNL